MRRYYSISLDQEESKRSKAAATDSFIGKVRSSDRKCMEYTLYDDGAAPEDKKEKGRPLPPPAPPSPAPARCPSISPPKT